MTKKGDEWLTSAEVRKVLKISTCDLAHLRVDGTVRTEKQGNAYYYPTKDVESLRRRKLAKGAGLRRLNDRNK